MEPPGPPGGDATAPDHGLLSTPGTDLTRMALNAARLGVDIVEVAGVLDNIKSSARTQSNMIEAINADAAGLVSSNVAMQTAAADVEQTCIAGQELLTVSIAQIRALIGRSQEVARWVAEVNQSMEAVTTTLREVEATNQVIAGISRQVNILAVNAKIEAARAGESGRGFAVVAEAINDLSRKTATSAGRISDAITALTESVGAMQAEAELVSGDAQKVLDGGTETDAAMSEIAEHVDRSAEAAHRIAAQSAHTGAALQTLTPAFVGITEAARDTAQGIEELSGRVHAMIDTSELLVQQTVTAGGATTDSLFIEDVQHRAAVISQKFLEALDTGQISEADLFSGLYTPIAGTDPPQVLAPFTELTDSILPAIQEPALTIDRRVVFCAAVDRNGYLPTHNTKFSKLQGDDPIWNAAHARNRRVFDDRVGLKAGRNSRPFLLQTYRRDMGGGRFAMMKDVSAPIVINGRHWGGLRLAYRPD